MTNSWWLITAFDTRSGGAYECTAINDDEKDRIVRKLKDSGYYDNVGVRPYLASHTGRHPPSRPNIQSSAPRTKDVAQIKKAFIKPFSTYPEDRERLIKLADVVLDNALAGLESNDAVELADLVKSILEDEQHRDENT